MDSRIAATQATYDRVARIYADRFTDELAHKPADRALLDRVADQLRGQGPVCDLGCGPGQIARALHERGLEVSGIDLSPAMIEQARRLHPMLTFQQGDMLALTDVPDAHFAGLTAFYSIIHLPRPAVPQALAEMRRVLRPGGLLLLAFHITSTTGATAVHLDEWFGEPADLDVAFHQPAEIIALLAAAGFELVEAIERPPYASEYQSQRAYLLARREVVVASC